MKVDSSGFFRPGEIASAALALEESGYDAVWAAEASHDAFIGLGIAADHTSRIGIGTGIAVAFARTPMTAAIAANDLQLISQGRFMLGLGSQIKPHITKRYSMPWSAPAARMREFVLALHAIWDGFETGEPIRFEGEHYTHTLMAPMFNPGPNPYGRAPVYLAGVGPGMTEVAGEVADGFICHPLTTRRYIQEVTLPALEAGRAKDERGLKPLDIAGMPFVITGQTEQSIQEAILGTKKQIAFYGSTPAYRPVLELHGFGALQDELNAMSKRGLWDEMGTVIPDEFVDLVAVTGAPEEIAGKLQERYGDLLHRMSFYTMYKSDPQIWPQIIRALKEV